MTRGYWKCKNCGYTLETHISFFIKRCPECKAEYELLGNLLNFHVCHDIPIFRVKGEDFSEFLTNHYYLIVRSSKKPLIRCINKDFYNYFSTF